MGLQKVKTLSKEGATVIAPARDIKKAKRNLASISHVELDEMDLAKMLVKNY
ncbi:hypothetical protein [Chryseobacterium indoltheticum]|uniref:hypothetical protein n=1 Tax=Chryseobacterium indoltheticum TaxID=254 RepID=UPI001F4504B4|nr:hypothetical protein [Chryseobacterium indoltheticum]